MSDVVSVDYRGRIAIITINNPKKLNALTKDGFYQIAKYLREIETHDEVFITVLIGKGRFFSAGADVSISRTAEPGVDIWRRSLRETVSSNLNMTQAFYSHSKILTTALNGPVVGLAAALVAFSDFVFCLPHAYLLTPFSSLGLVAEGGASLALVKRMGISKANEALLMSRRISADELLACGFVNNIFDCGEGVGVDEIFLKRVLEHVDETLGSHLIGSSLIETKKLISMPMRKEIDTQLVAELFGGLERVKAGIPQREFEKMRLGQKRHKL